VCTIRVVLEKGGGRPRLTNMLGAIDLKRSIGKWGLVIAMPVLKKTYRHYTYFQGDKTSVAFACFECRKVFKRRVTLRPSVKPQICSQCGQECGSRVPHSKHLTKRTASSGVRPKSLLEAVYSFGLTPAIGRQC